MEIYELLDRFELLYEDSTPDISNLRRAIIDNDLSSLFQILKKYEDEELIENIRSAVCDLNPWAFYKIYKNEDAEDFKKFILNKNIWSLFKILQKLYLKKEEVLNDIKCIATTEYQPIDMLYPLFRIINSDDDIKTIAVSNDPLNEETVQALFRILQNIIDEPIVDELRRAVTGETFSTKMRPVFSVFKDDKFIRNYYTATNTEHASGQARLNATFNVVSTLLENNAVVTDLRAIVAHDNRPAMYNCLDYVLDSDLVRILERFEKEKPEYNLHDAFTQGQLRSKLWLLKHLRGMDLGTVFICAGWYGTLARTMFENEHVHFDKIRSFDIDPKCAEVADTINRSWVKDAWQYKSSTLDIHDLNYTDSKYKVKKANGTYEVLTDSPNTIINTSCEHIKNFDDWFNLIPADKLVALQSNDYFEIQDHVNCVNSLDEFKQQAPLSNIIYEGKLELEKYTRYMIIGYA
ncbi:MAG: hypothetical protein CL489_04085 [Acidobacteria bacterium]|nr:hypothetical protein [Acidobacteriota bacterium]